MATTKKRATGRKSGARKKGPGTLRAQVRAARGEVKTAIRSLQSIDKRLIRLGKRISGGGQNILDKNSK